MPVVFGKPVGNAHKMGRLADKGVGYRKANIDYPRVDGQRP
jgi:hypothetical protein